MRKQRAIRTTTALVGILFLAVSSLLAQTLLAQTLARPGWVGSGLTTQTWFKHAVFYEIDTRTFSDSNGDGVGDLKGITQRLDYIQSLGTDAILLEPLGEAQTAGQSGRAQLAPIDPPLGTLNDFDDLTLQASRLKIRVLVELSTPDAGLARFWLTRGVAGFYIPGSAPANTAGIQAIRKLLPGYVGQRVLITDAVPADPSRAKLSPDELSLDRAVLKAASAASASREYAYGLRAAMDESQAFPRNGTTVFAITDSTGSGEAVSNPDLARIALAAVLLNRSAALITAGQELGLAMPPGNAALMPWGRAAAVVEEASEPAKPPAPVIASPDKYTHYVPYVRPVAPKKPVPPDPASAAGQESNPSSLLNFYKRLSLLHHGTTALHDGEEITLDHGGQSALIWVRRPPSPSLVNPPIVVACNLSDKPIMLSLRSDIAWLQLRGNFLRTLLRSDDAMGGASIDPLTLPAYDVYVGELRR